MQWTQIVDLLLFFFYNLEVSFGYKALMGNDPSGWHFLCVAEFLEHRVAPEDWVCLDHR